MGHEIDNTNGQYSFADSQSDAWHQLGQQVGHTMEPLEALRAANMLGWDVRKVPLRADIQTYLDDEGELLDPLPSPVVVPVPGKFTILRTNPVTKQPQPLGVIGAWWTPFQNEATTELLYNITDQSGAHIQTIGALDEGRRTFVTMLMPDHMELTAPTGFKDVTKLYLAVFNHHDGQGALRALITPTRVVCANTQRIAEANAISQVTIRHTGEAHIRLEEVRRILGLTYKYQEVYAAEMERLARKSMDEADVRLALNDVFEAEDADGEKQRENRLDKAVKVMEVYRNDDTVNMWRGTAFGAYNAVTRYLDHRMSLGAVKANSRVVGSDADRRALRTLGSTSIATTKARAFEVLSAA